MPALWRRVVFNVCDANTDDHLRNHGFLWTLEGWRLCPANDLSPSTAQTELAIPDDGVTVDLDLVRASASVYRLYPSQADRVLAAVIAAVRQWRSDAERFGIPSGECEAMASACRLAERGPRASKASPASAVRP